MGVCITGRRALRGGGAGQVRGGRQAGITKPDCCVCCLVGLLIKGRFACHCQPSWVAHAAQHAGGAMRLMGSTYAVQLLCQVSQKSQKSLRHNLPLYSLGKMSGVYSWPPAWVCHVEVIVVNNAVRGSYKVQVLPAGEICSGPAHERHVHTVCRTFL